MSLTLCPVDARKEEKPGLRDTRPLLLRKLRFDLLEALQQLLSVLVQPLVQQTLLVRAALRLERSHCFQRLSRLNHQLPCRRLLLSPIFAEYQHSCPVCTHANQKQEQETHSR